MKRNKIVRNAANGRKGSESRSRKGIAILAILGVAVVVCLLLLALLLFHANNASRMNGLHPVPLSALAAYADKHQRIMAQGRIVQPMALTTPGGENLAFERVVIGHSARAVTAGHPSYLKIDHTESHPDDFFIAEGQTQVAVKSSDIDEDYLTQLEEGIGSQPKNVTDLLGKDFGWARNMMDANSLTRVYAFYPGDTVTIVGAIRSENGVLRLVSASDGSLIVSALPPAKLIKRAVPSSDTLIVLWTFLIFPTALLACILFPWPYASHRSYSRLTPGEKVRLIATPLFLAAALILPFFV